MAIREVDAISNAIIETEREIAGDAWDIEDTERDESGDTSLESMGEGLEGQHEAEDDDEADGDDAEGDEGSEDEGDEGEGEGEGEAAAAAAAQTGDGKEPKPGEGERQPSGRVPAGRLREANERARKLQEEIDILKADKGPSPEIKALSDQLAAATRRIDELSRGQTQTRPALPVQEKQEPQEAPDLFEDPKGFVAHVTNLVQQAIAPVRGDLRKTEVNTSFRIAHVAHKDTFDKAFAAINSLDPQNPDDRATVARIYNSSDPGEALVAWHKRQSTLAEVGDDPTAYREKVARETREALMKDPDFKKQLLAELRGEAQRGGADGGPRTETRLPRSLARAGGSNLGADRPDQHARDDSEQSVADSAWR